MGPLVTYELAPLGGVACREVTVSFVHPPGSRQVVAVLTASAGWPSIFIGGPRLEGRPCFT